MNTRMMLEGFLLPSPSEVKVRSSGDDGDDDNDDDDRTHACGAVCVCVLCHVCAIRKKYCVRSCSRVPPRRDESTPR